MSDLLHQTDAILRLRQLSEASERGQMQSDAELLSLYVEGGNCDAIESLIKRYAPMVASVCRLTVADTASAEDAFQATFLVLLKSAKKIRRQTSVAAWLHGVAYRTASRIRKQGRVLSSQSCDEVITQCDPMSEPIAQLARKMELEALDRELEALPDQLRAPLVEHYLLGFSAPQIAERMELSITAVEGRLKRGRRRLRTLLARRGISLSVLVAGSSLLQEHLAATEAIDWTKTFLDSHFSQSDGQLSQLVKTEPTSPQVSSLVNGELSMLSTSSLKTSFAVGMMLAGALAVAAIDPIGVGNAGEGAAPGPPVLTIPDLNPIQQVVAQFGNVASEAPKHDHGNVTATDSAVDSAFALNSAILEGIQWERPQTPDGAEPSWLAGGKTSMESIEKNRIVLAQTIDFDFQESPLPEIASWLSEQTGTQFEIDATELDLIGIDSDSPITLHGRGSVREFLRRALKSLELTYVVTESTIEITSKDAADSQANMRFYDLAYILPNPANSQAVILAIEQTIDPDSWLNAGGTSSIAMVGSMMIVAAPDTTHQQIEILLLNISRMNPKNVEKTIPMRESPGMPSGMGGMGGGMGGGGGMF